MCPVTGYQFPAVKINPHGYSKSNKKQGTLQTLRKIQFTSLRNSPLFFYVPSGKILIELSSESKIILGQLLDLHDAIRSNFSLSRMNQPLFGS